MIVVNRFEGYSRAVIIIDGGLTFLFTGGLRLFIRLSCNGMDLKRKTGGHDAPVEKQEPKKVLVYGGGDTGEKILRELMQSSRPNYRVMGIIDDDRSKRGRTIHGVTVLGGLKQLPRIKKRYLVQEVLIAVPSATGQQMRTIVETCKACGLSFKTMPGIAELIDGKVSIKTFRDVSYRDLLRREPVVLDSEKISGYLKDKTVMVTGAGGSIGSELCRQIVRFAPRQLILFDSSEPNLYAIQMELKHRITFMDYVTILGGIQDADLVDRVLSHYQPAVIFHAAAYKHVPMLERNPWQAVMNNIRGNQVVIQKAVAHKVGRFILVSTDKAVRPTNIMGASKRISELMVQAHQGNGTRMMTVRFGNVLGSAGSVIPLFREQIERGGPVTVTHPEATRFFMTIPEAAQLILQAGGQGTDGEIFILNMGIPIKILDMARDLIRLSGKEPDVDIKIQFMGLRQGEKLQEELITQGEGVVDTSHNKIMVLKSHDPWNGCGTQEIFRKNLMEEISRLFELAKKHDAAAIRNKMKEIVPEYKPQNISGVV